MPATHSAERFAGQAALIAAAQAMLAYYLAQKRASTRRRDDVMDVSDVHLGTLSMEELIQVVDAIWGKCVAMPGVGNREDARTASTTGHFDPYVSPFSGQHIAERSG